LLKAGYNKVFTSVETIILNYPGRVDVKGKGFIAVDKIYAAGITGAGIVINLKDRSL
jgi:hypothetical protein